jgi:hypothetical protein
MRAIETEYAGYRFRSRLEARWAVFFDAVGIRWQYEPEGFQRSLGADETGAERLINYLPDFYLPNSQTWVEVKGSDELLARDVERISFMLEHNSPLPGVDYSFEDDSAETRGLLILGDIPHNKFGVALHPLIQQDSSRLYHRKVFFVPDDLRATPTEPDLLHSLFGVPRVESGDFKWTTQAIQIGTPRLYTKVRDAYTSARQARFEHGQIGAPTQWA